MSANEVRHRQAFEAAQAGLDRAMIFVTTAPRGIDKNNDNVADAGPSETLPNGSKYFVAFCQPGTALPTCPDTPGAPTCSTPTPDNFNTPTVVACGWSDDNIARQFLTQSISTTSTILNAPTNPLTAKGAMNVGGSANVVNYFNNLTVWSGGPLTSIGNAGKTFIRNPTVPPPQLGTTPPGEPNSCTTTANYVCVTDKNITGPDVIDNDPTLGNLASGELFKNYFGKSLSEFKSGLAPSQIISANNAGGLAGARGDTFFIEGDTVFPNATIGTRERPVVLIVDGNVSFQGTPTIHGIVYVTGNVTGGGNPKIMGAMVVAGNISPTGSVDIIFDPFVSQNASYKTGTPGWITGSWRDWR